MAATAPRKSGPWPRLPPVRAAHGRDDDATLNPNRVPQRVVPNRCHQSSANRICHDVSRDIDNVFFTPDSVIVKSPLPDTLQRSIPGVNSAR